MILFGTHPDLNELRDFVDGKTAKDKQQELEQHVLTCKSCLRALSTMADCEMTRKAREAIRWVSTSEDTPLPNSLIAKRPPT